MESRKQNQNPRSARSARALWIAAIAVLLCLYLVPYLRSGLMNNDSLFEQYHQKLGFREFFRFYHNELIGKGRALSSWILPILQYPEYAGRSTYGYRALQMVLIFLDAAAFGKLVRNVWGDSFFAAFSCVCWLLFLPVSFESTLPNAYVTHYAPAMLALLLALDLFWIAGQEEGGRSKKAVLLRVGAMMLYFFACCIYEAFIAYLPICCLAAAAGVIRTGENTAAKSEGSGNIGTDAGRKGVSNSENNAVIRAAAAPLLTGIAYLALYVIMRKAFPSNYGGNQIAFTVAGAAKNLAYLLLHSFPGGLLISLKYLYLFLQGKGEWLTASGIVRAAAVSVLAGGILFHLMRTRRGESDDGTGEGHFFLRLLTLLVTSALPILPIAVSSLYQGQIGGNGYLQLSVSYFASFSSILIVTMIVWRICGCDERWGGRQAGSQDDRSGAGRTGRRPGRVISVIMAVLLAAAGFAVQLGNEVFSHQTHEDYMRIRRIQDYFDSYEMRALEGCTVESPDLFETRHSMAVHEQYWTEYIRNVDHYELTVVPEAENPDYFLDEMPDGSLVLTETQDDKNIQEAEEVRNNSETEKTETSKG